mgnify:FL=1
MKKLDTALIEPILREHNVEYAGIFGSQARGDNRPNSDIDILVRFDRPVGMFAFVGLQNKLFEATGKKIDLVTENALSPYIKDKILSELVTIYGRR